MRVKRESDGPKGCFGTYEDSCGRKRNVQSSSSAHFCIIPSGYQSLFKVGPCLWPFVHQINVVTFHFLTLYFSYMYYQLIKVSRGNILFTYFLSSYLWIYDIHLWWYNVEKVFFILLNSNYKEKNMQNLTIYIHSDKVNASYTKSFWLGGGYVLFGVFV